MIDLLTSPIHQCHRLELQTGFTRRVSHRFTRRDEKLRARSNTTRLTPFSIIRRAMVCRWPWRFDVSTGGLLRQRALHRWLDRRRRRDRLGRCIIDDLHIHCETLRKIVRRGRSTLR